MQLATQEAVAAKFSFIEPEHLLMAVLKIAELPADGLGDAFPSAAADLAGLLSSEIKELKDMRAFGSCVKSAACKEPPAASRIGGDASQGPNAEIIIMTEKRVSILFSSRLMNFLS